MDSFGCPFFLRPKSTFLYLPPYINFSKGGIFVIRIVHNTDSDINEEKLYSIFVDIIHDIKMQEEDANEEKNNSIHEM